MFLLSSNKRRAKMKKIFPVTVFVMLTVFLNVSNYSFAQSGTLVVYASGPTLDKVIGADTTANGLQVHSVYQLVSLDTTYIFDATITSKSGIQIIGVPDPTTGKLPCIQPDVLQDGSIPGTFFAFTGQGTRVTFKNIYFEGLAINNTFGYGVAIHLVADSITLTADNLVFDEFSGDAFLYSSNWDNLYITNCRMRNSVTSAADYYEGEFVRNDNNAGTFSTDSIVIRDCTLNCVAGYVCADTRGITNYFECSHCDVINGFKNPFFLDRMVNAKIDNNLFYNAYAGGESKVEFGGYDSFTPNTGPALIVMGPLDSTTAALLLGHASTGPGDPAAEMLRMIEVKNNDYYWSSDLTTFWHNFDDTATVDSVYTTTFMNDTTAYMFNNPSKWPGFVASGNMNADPGFGASIDASLNSGTGYASGLLGYFTLVRKGTGTTEVYGCQITNIPQPQPGDYTPPWPLPEANDLKYSNSSLMTAGTDGKPVGDLYWFDGLADGVKVPPETAPAKFSLSNNYPNPFNPSTIINISLPHNGTTSLNVYNVLGQLVMTVANGEMAQGAHEFTVNMDRFASGIYFYTLRQGVNSLTKKMILLK
jgi:Secretion system C-terminal sorting domain